MNSPSHFAKKSFHQTIVVKYIPKLSTVLFVQEFLVYNLHNFYWELTNNICLLIKINLFLFKGRRRRCNSKWNGKFL